MKLTGPKGHQVVSFSMSMFAGGNVFVTDSRDSLIDARMNKLLLSSSPGTKVHFEKILLKGPDGKEKKLPSLTITM